MQVRFAVLVALALMAQVAAAVALRTGKRVGGWTAAIAQARKRLPAKLGYVLGVGHGAYRSIA